MKKYLDVLERCSLFSNMTRDDMQNLMLCIDSRVKSFARGDYIIRYTGDIRHVGVVLSGNAQVVKEDPMGNRNIIAHLEEADIFAEVFACAGIRRSPVSVIATGLSEILFIDLTSIVTTCRHACSFHHQLIANLLATIANKNLALSDKASCLGRRTTREKIEEFLLIQMERAGKNPFEIPFTRAEMADYLCVDRSAMSAVLCKMRDEGLIKFNKNRFELLPGFGEDA